MDLIKIYERAKKAGIIIDIRISGGEFERVDIIGHIEADTYENYKKYAKTFSIDGLKESKLSGEDIVELAMDEIIENLRPKLDWEKAEAHLRFMMDLYRGIGWTGMFGLQLGLRPLEDRFMSGERTRELYDEIMALE